MASITVRNLDGQLKHRLWVRAARNGRSIEAEVRAILIEAVGVDDGPTDILTSLRESAAALGGVDLDIPPRTGRARVVEFDE